MNDLYLTGISQNDGKLKYTFYPLPGGPWQPIVDVNAKESNDPGQLYAVDCAVDGNYLHVTVATNVNFDPTNGGKLWHTIHFLDDDWQPCFVDVKARQKIDPGLFYRPVSCAAAFGLLHVFGLTTEDGKPWHTTRNTVTGVWQDFEDVDSKVPNGIIPGAFFGVDCAVIDNGDLHVVLLISADAHQENLYHIVLPFRGTWQDYHAVQSQASTVPGPFASVGCAAAGGDLHFVGVTGDGVLWHSILPAGQSLWQDFENVSAKALNTPGPFINDQNGVSCAVADNGDLHVVALSPNGELWRTFLPFGTDAWQPFEDVNAQLPNNPGPFLAVGIASPVNFIQ